MKPQTFTDDCHDILCRGQVVRLGLVETYEKDQKKMARAYVVPLNYGYDSKNKLLYMHTNNRAGSHKMKLIKDAVKEGGEVCFEVETDVKILPLAGGTNCLSTTRYCSVIGYGEFHDNYDEKQKGDVKKEALKYILRQNTGISLKFWNVSLEGMPDDLVVLRLHILRMEAKRHGYEF